MTIIRSTLIASVGMAALSIAPATAAIIQFDLIGRAGPGLLPGNEIHTVNGIVGGPGPGSGGEIGQGIFFNTDTNELTINVGWGTGNGFTNLTGNATVGHIHGLTASASPASFNETASVRYGLDNLAGWTNGASNGSFIGTIVINAADVQPLLDGRMYINVHTSTNGPGEIRGQLVPAPGATGLLALGGLLVSRRRRA